MHGLPFAHSVLVSSAGCYDVRWVPQQRAGTAKTARMGVRDPRGPSAFCMYICKTARAMSVLRIHSQTSTRLHTSSGNQRSALHDSAANSKRYVCTWSNCPKWAKCTFGTCMSDGFRMHPTCTLLTAPRSSHASPPASAYICEPSTYVANARPIPAHTYARRLSASGSGSRW